MKLSPSPAVRLFAYKMTHDVGFAPNPFRGLLTLATCKPRIRLHKVVGDWIAGFTSTRLNGDELGHERLVYLMQVTDKRTLAEYHDESAFSAKIPKVDPARCVDGTGDNIYGIRDGALFQVKNRYHDESSVERDTSGQFALISNRFAYFGSQPLIVPDEVRPSVPSGVAGHGVRTADPARALAFIDYVLSHGTGIHAAPTTWPRNDDSWRERSCG